MHRLAFATLFFAACLPGFDPTDTEPPPPPIDQPPAPVTEVAVHIRDAGLGVSGINVVFQAADDLVIAERVTDATGVAVAEMPDGGSVTIIRSEIDDAGETRTTAFTYTGVKPGDLLDLANPTARGTAPITVQLTVPTPDPEEGLGAYLVLTPCGAAAGLAPSIEITLEGCGTETDFFVLDDTGGFLAHKTIAPVIDLSAEIVRENRETTLSVLNTPTGAVVALEKRLLTDGFLMFASGLVPADVTTSVPDIGATSADQLVVAHVGDGVDIGQRVASRSPYSNNTATVDLANMLLPTVRSPLFDGTAVAWVETGGGPRDFAVATITDGTISRVLVGANVDPAIRVPVLPGSYGIALGVDAQVTVSIGKATGGYDAVRGHVLGGNLLDAAPMNGQIAISEIVQLP